jgi:hypothetical protein
MLLLLLGIIGAVAQAAAAGAAAPAGIFHFLVDDWGWGDASHGR